MLRRRQLDRKSGAGRGFAAPSATTLGQSYAGLVAGLPGALTTYAQKLAAGDFTGAVGAFMPIAMGPFMTPHSMQLMNIQNFVKTQFDVARDLTNAAIAGVPGPSAPDSCCRCTASSAR